MYKCLDCGCEFDDPNYIKESHGELYPHCPSCGGGNFTEIEDFKCKACLGIKAEIDEEWCEECKTVVRQIMSYSVTKCLKTLGLPLSSGTQIIDAYQDVFDQNDIIHEATEAKHLMCAIVDIAEDRGCPIDTAWEMAEQWVYDSRSMRYAGTRR